jgi:hypothetical protein
LLFPEAREIMSGMVGLILSASAILGIVATLMTTLPPVYMFSSPLYQGVYPIMGALGAVLAGFSILAFVIAMIPYKKGERWAWFTLWILPLQRISQTVLSPDVSYLVLVPPHRHWSYLTLPTLLLFFTK